MSISHFSSQLRNLKSQIYVLSPLTIPVGPVAQHFFPLLPFCLQVNLAALQSHKYRQFSIVNSQFWSSSTETIRILFAQLTCHLRSSAAHSTDYALALHYPFQHNGDRRTLLQSHNNGLLKNPSTTVASFRPHGAGSSSIPWARENLFRFFPSSSTRVALFSKVY